MKHETGRTNQRTPDDNGLRELLMQLCTAVKHLEAAHTRLIAALRPTHDRRFVSEATQFSEACADQLEAVREGLDALGVQVEAA